MPAKTTGKGLNLLRCVKLFKSASETLNLAQIKFNNDLFFIWIVLLYTGLIHAS